MVFVSRAKGSATKEPRSDHHMVFISRAKGYATIKPRSVFLMVFVSRAKGYAVKKPRSDPLKTKIYFMHWPRAQHLLHVIISNVPIHKERLTI